MCCTRTKINPVNIVKGFGAYALGINEKLSVERMKVCNNCPEMRPSSCSVCGCNLQAKTRVGAESCPLGKWLPVDVAA